jgi:hypothetical protein
MKKELMRIEPEAGLRAVLRALALGPAEQLALFPPPNCPVHALARLPSEWLEHSDAGRAGGFLESLTAPRREAVSRVEAAVKDAWREPCGEPERLEAESFRALRRAARDALEIFDWPPTDPDPALLVGRPEFATFAEADAARRKGERIARRPRCRVREPFDDVPEHDPRGLTPEAFLALLDCIPWFAHLGQPHELDREVDRIVAWSDWGGPERRGSDVMGRESAIWQEALLASVPDPGPIEAVFAQADSRTNDAITRRIDFEVEGDPWQPQSSAVGGACWLAGTLAAYLFAGVPIPLNVLRQWEWYVLGHWPCLYSEDDDLESIVANWPDLDLNALTRVRLVVF